MILVPRASLGTEHSSESNAATFGVLGPIAEGIFVGPVLIQVTTASAVLVAVRFGLGRSADATAAALAASVGAVPLRAGSAAGPGGPFWRFPTGGGSESVLIPWGLRTAGGSSFVVFVLAISAAVPVECTLVVGAQELVADLPAFPEVSGVGAEGA